MKAITAERMEAASTGMPAAKGAAPAALRREAGIAMMKPMMAGRPRRVASGHQCRPDSHRDQASNTSNQMAYTGVAQRLRLRTPNAVIRTTTPLNR